MNEPATFGARLKSYRLRARLSQRELGELAGIGERTIRAAEHGDVVAPRAITVQLLAAVLRLAPTERAAFEEAAKQCRATASTTASSSHHIPTPPTPLIGRENDVATLVQLLRQENVRLVTLTGPGGVGKTRVAVHVALESVHDYADGVRCIDLAPLTDASLVTAAIAQDLRVREEADRPLADTICAVMSDKRILLVLDNFERVLPAASLVAHLQATCPYLTVLVTSRVPLHLRGEREIEITPLAVPNPREGLDLQVVVQSPAVVLFQARAQDVRADFAVTAENAPDIAEICHRLDGLPLAIELAAARMKIFPPAALVAHLERRLPLLSGGARDLPARQQTMRRALDWSYDLLDSSEQRLFRRLAVFAGGWTMDAVNAVCDGTKDLGVGVLEGLCSLVDKSLLRRPKEGRTLRFLMLETAREYGQEQLEMSGESAQVQQAHCLYYVALAEHAEPYLTSLEQDRWLDRLADEHDNLRAALTHADETAQTILGLRLAGALWRFWSVRGHLSEGRTWLQTFLEQTKETHVATAEGETAPLATRAKALYGAGVLAYEQGDYDEAASLYEQSLSLYRALKDTQGSARVLTLLGNIAHQQGDYERERTIYEECLRLYRDLEDAEGTAAALQGLGGVALEQAEYGRAASFYDECLLLRRKIGNTLGIATVLQGLAGIAFQRGNYEQARTLYDESITLHWSLGHAWGAAISIEGLANVAYQHGDFEQASALLEESLAIRRELGDKLGVAASLHRLASVADQRGEFARALALHEESLAIRRMMGDTRGLTATLRGLGLLAMQQADVTRAATFFGESLTLAHKAGLKVGIVQALECLALLANTQGYNREAVRLGSVAATVRVLMDAPLPPIERDPFRQAVADAQAALGAEPFAATWSEAETIPLGLAIDEALQIGQRMVTPQASTMLAECP